MKSKQRREAGARDQGPKRGQRRGVLLLVVLSLLVLFALIGVTFVLVAGQHLRSTQMALRDEQTGDDPRQLCDAVLAQIVRDTNNAHSVLRGHSLLADLYGNDGIKITYPGGGSITPTMAGTTEQMIDLTLPVASRLIEFAAPPSGVPTPVPPMPPAVPFSEQRIQTPGYYNGCVLTMLDGPAAGRSTRIVGWGYDTMNSTYTIRVTAFEGLALATLQGGVATSAILVNGRPFNGTGFGFNPSADPQNDATLLSSQQRVVPSGGVFTPVTYPYALLPNPVFADPSRPPDIEISPPVQDVDSYLVFGGIGGADEDYDAADPQNMLLAYMPLNPTGPGDIIPSLHRPNMLRYLDDVPEYDALPAGNKVKALFDRQSSLRPTPTDHPEFDGSNPDYRFLNPMSWDVDNDGDGIPDSVWVDPGFPVKTTPDGRTYKAMVAILCLDLDGRLNVNAHGNVAQANTRYSNQIAPGGPGNETLADYLFQQNGPMQATLSRGSGYGPAEINLNLAGIFSGAAYAEFFAGKATGGRSYEGRYGEFGTTAMNPTAYPYPLPGRTDVMPPAPDDVLASIQRYGLPVNYYAGVSGYGSPSDLWGRAAVGVDYAGQPIYSFLKQTLAMPTDHGKVSSATLNPPDPDRPNDPYTVNLSRRRIRAAEQPPTTDNPFTPAELERILRRYDADAAMLPERLAAFINPNNANDPARLITTDSYDLPGPATVMTRDFATHFQAQNGVLPSSVSLHDLLRAKLAEVSGRPPNDPLVSTQLQSLLRHLPRELGEGVRFDLNRPFGNGEDDDGNGTVDEPTEFNVNSEVPTSWPAGFSPAGMDLNNDGTVDGNPINFDSDVYARQQYAKYLYILMMLLTDHGYGLGASYPWALDDNVRLTPTDPELKELTARRIAQWAINCADFRDPDSIMTPFEYDVNPFNDANADDDPWDVDGLVGTADAGVAERRVVWGCEYPELLLTETMALHDRRVRDRVDDGGAMNDRAGSVMSRPADPDLDQWAVPQGSVFFELYCTRSANGSAGPLPRELYDGAGRLDLGKMDQNGAGTNPVWRIAITPSSATTANNVNRRAIRRPDKTNFDPVSPGSDPKGYSVFNPANSLEGPIVPERYVWFSAADPSGHPDAGQIFYNTGGMPTQLNPGQYALVGPRPATFVGKNALNIANPVAQQIQLAPAVVITDANGQDVYAANQVNAPLPIICSSPALPAGWINTHTPGGGHNIGVSVSEPLFSSPNYYPPPPPGPMGDYPVLNYASPVPDEPLDAQAGRPLGDDTAAGLANVMHTGTTPNYKTALLQRLANPLLAFHPVTNPYITVDWQPIDLTVFNGEELNDSAGVMGAFDPHDPNWPDIPPDPFPAGHTLANRERGTGNPSNPNLWRITPQFLPGAQVPRALGDDVFNYSLPHTLGFLNAALGTPWPQPAAADPVYAGAPTPSPTSNTFPWLPWNNRPFVSDMELLLVPATSAEELLRHFDSISAASANPYPALPPDPNPFHQPCRHLLNMMISENGLRGRAPYFYRLLEYVHVPSRFVGTDTVLDPSITVPEFLPPFNKVSNYRDPGRVNINTIPGLAGATVDSPAWRAILNNGPGPGWDKIVASRRGGPAGNVTAPVPGSPTAFPNPFRSAGGSAFTLPGVSATPPHEVNVTLLRPDPATPTQPLFHPSSTTPYTDPDRNPFFRYQPLARTSNLLTTRSNVYAIWITVGYFEVTAMGVVDNYDKYPDGYQFGQEIGIDTGEVVRHRAFYIYDRSIPVGFEPGQDHNFEDGLLVRRFIE